MITITNIAELSKNCMKGLSTDTKPTTAEVNSTIYELDTGDIYYFDGEEWKKGGLPVVVTDKNADEYGTLVEANPELAGTESALTGLKVGNTKYKVPESKKVYKHYLAFRSAATDCNFDYILYNDSPTQITTVQAFITATDSKYIVPTHSQSTFQGGSANIYKIRGFEDSGVHKISVYAMGLLYGSEYCTITSIDCEFSGADASAYTLTDTVTEI